MIDITSRLGVSCKNSKFVDNAEITLLFQELLIYIEQNNIEKQLKEFDDDNNEYPMFRWCRMYMDEVLLLLAFHRSIKTPYLFLYLVSIEQLATYFFACNRLDYAQNMLEFTWNRLVNGAFAVTKHKIPFTSIGLDQAQEHEYKSLKGQGGLNGIPTKPSVLLKYCLTAPALKRIATEPENMFNIEHKEEKKHHHLNNPVKLRQEKAVHAMIKVIGEQNMFQDKNELYNIINKRVSDEAKGYIRCC